MARRSASCGDNVHDVIESPDVTGPGMVFCVNVGIYHEAWGIGFRLEDNCLVTEDRCENLSAMIPRTVEEIEDTMRKKKIIHFLLYTFLLTRASGSLPVFLVLKVSDTLKSLKEFFQRDFPSVFINVAAFQRNQIFLLLQIFYNSFSGWKGGPGFDTNVGSLGFRFVPEAEIIHLRKFHTDNGSVFFFFR